MRVYLLCITGYLGAGSRETVFCQNFTTALGAKRAATGWRRRHLPRDRPWRWYFAVLPDHRVTRATMMVVSQRRYAGFPHTYFACEITTVHLEPSLMES